MPETALPTIPATACTHMPPDPNLRPGETLCDYCVAKCCRYFALPIDKPKRWEDFDYIRWYLLHRHAAVFVEDGDWYLLIQTPCQHLRDDHRCGIYDTRPRICRDYTTTDCEYGNDWTYEHYWEAPEQIEEYAEAVLGPRKGASYRTAKPVSDPQSPISNL